MKVLITGAGGQLGRALTGVFDGHDVVGVGRELDVADEPAVSAVVHGHAPDLVVHAAAWTDVDGCERDPERAHRVNTLGTWWVARACERVGADLAFLSTDHVFAGDGDRPLTEFDPVAPVNAYGRSKAAAETLVRETLARHYIVRTAWLAGPGGSNFVSAVLARARAEGRVTVVDDEVGSPTFTADLASAIRELVVTGRYGTYHRTNAGSASRFELAAAALELAGSSAEVQRTSSDRLERPARRPAYAVLDNRHAELTGLMTLRHWRQALGALLGSGGADGD